MLPPSTEKVLVYSHVCDGQGCDGKLGVLQQKQVTRMVHEQEGNTSHDELVPHQKNERLLLRQTMRRSEKLSNSMFGQTVKDTFYKLREKRKEKGKKKQCGQEQQ